MEVKLYTNFSDNRMIRKNISLLSTAECVIKGDMSMEHPVIILSSSYYDNSCNYAFLSEYGRYYYVNDKRFLTGGRVELHLDVDVLVTYQYQIAKCKGIVKRSSTQGNSYLADEKLKVTSKVRTQVYKSSGSFNDGLNYVLTVCG